MSWSWQPAHEVSAVSLQTLAFNITTFGGRLRMAGRRGENVQVPFREGRLWVPKVYEETTLSLAMWVIGANEDGSIPANPSAQFWENVEKLRRLFWTDRQLGILSFAHPTLAATVYAEAEIVDAIDFETDAGATRAAFVVDFVLPAVWFRPATSTDSGPTGRTDGATWSQTWDTDVPIKDPVITFARSAGSPSTPRLYNKSLSSGDHWLEYRDVLGVGDSVAIDVGAWRATLNGTTDVSNNLFWSGQPEFFQLIPGQNDFEFADPGGGTTAVTIAGKGRYW